MEADSSAFRRARPASSARPAMTATIPRPVLATQRLELVPLTDEFLEWLNHRQRAQLTPTEGTRHDWYCRDR
jgi:hypothetical protein